ncbi:hypothetical protein QEN19_001148 [Hanseniaspora menglaensis]
MSLEKPSERQNNKQSNVKNVAQDISLSQIVKKEHDLTPLRHDIAESLRYIEDLKFFLVTAPIRWMDNQIIRKYYLNEELDYISCIYWDNIYYISGTDIIKILIFRFEKFGRRIINKKKFEEGIFSDLRNLKVNEHCILQMPRSAMLQFLHKNNCIKTQKRQKVFFWFSVLHDRLFADCLERDLKREQDIQKIHQSAKIAGKSVDDEKVKLLEKTLTTKSVSEPALSFKCDLSNVFKTKNNASRRNDEITTNNVFKNRLYDQLIDYMQSFDMVKTPSAVNIQFDFNSNINDNSIFGTSRQSKENNFNSLNENKNFLPHHNESVFKKNTTSTLFSQTPVQTNQKKRKNLNLSINVSDVKNSKQAKFKITDFVSNTFKDTGNNNNTISEHPQEYSTVEIEYQDLANTQENLNNMTNFELPLLTSRFQHPPSKKQKTNSKNNSVEYNKFMEQMMSPIGGFINPFNIQQTSGDKFLFNGVGFTPIRTAFPQDSQLVSQAYPQAVYGTNGVNNVETNQWYYMNMFAMPLQSANVFQQQTHPLSGMQTVMTPSFGFHNIQLTPYQVTAFSNNDKNLPTQNNEEKDK